MSFDRRSLPLRESRSDASDAPLDVRDLAEAPAAPRPPGAPVGAPNVLLVLIDDVGFGASSTFGGPCRTPTADKLAEDGLRYNQFHTTALCAPTRSALLTGRNHHTCGMGAVPEMATGSRGYNATRPPEVTTLPRMLQGNGYSTAAFGKMHQTPPWEQTPAGPFDRWPTQEGFDHFYGFLGAETNQFSPSLYRGTTPIDPPRTAEEGYHLSEDLADQTIDWISGVQAFSPKKPWFAYLSFGACHTPFHLPPEWRQLYRGAFDHGWDRQREVTLRRQKQMGLVPEATELAPVPPGVPDWDSLDDQQRLVAQRLMETYAAFLEHTDRQVGRVVDHLRDTAQLADTLVLYLIGDNGASAEGGIDGTLNEMLTVNGIPDTPDRVAAQLEQVGGPETYALYPAGWAVAMNTPFQWTKQIASHYGGTRNGLVVHWPAGMESRGGVRQQWHHVTDVAPTILDAAGIPEPEFVDGIAQVPMAGTSMRYTFDDPEAADRRTTQYFEIFGNRGIYHEGWTAVTKHRTPWEPARAQWPRFEEDVWELYDTRSDWSQARDLVDEMPEKLVELQHLFDREARRFDVYPLDDRLAERMNAEMAGRAGILGSATSVELPPTAGRLREDTVPNLKNASFVVEVDLEPSPDAGVPRGVLVAQGGRFGGWSLYLHAGVPTYCYNMLGVESYVVHGSSRLPGDASCVRLVFDYDGGGVGRGGTAHLYVDDEEFGAGRIERTVPFAFSVDETLNVGVDPGTPVSADYSFAPDNRVSGVVVKRVRIQRLGAESHDEHVGQRRAALAAH